MGKQHTRKQTTNKKKMFLKTNRYSFLLSLTLREWKKEIRVETSRRKQAAAATAGRDEEEQAGKQASKRTNKQTGWQQATSV